MEGPLDAICLLALVEDGIETGRVWIPMAKAQFAEENPSEGVTNLLTAFGVFRPNLRVYDRIVKDLKGADEWSIDFSVRKNGRSCQPLRLTNSAGTIQAGTGIHAPECQT